MRRWHLALLLLLLAGSVLGSSRDLLNVWHVPILPEPPGHTMRDPVHPGEGDFPLEIWLSAPQLPWVSGATLYYQRAGEPGWAEIQLVPDDLVQDRQFWLADLPGPHPDGTEVLYYLRATGLGGEATYVHGGDDESLVTGLEAVARAGAFRFRVGVEATPTAVPSPSPTHEPTIEPTPEPSTTGTPSTGTPTPTPTASAQPTQTPTPTTPLPTPTVFPTAAFTPTPPATPTLPPEDEIGSGLQISQPLFHAGDRLRLTAFRWNWSDRDVQVRQFVLLDIGGAYFFYPSWSQEPDYLEHYLQGGGQTWTETILDFHWPPGAGSAMGMLFWGAILDESGALLGDVTAVDFGFA